MDLQQSKWVDRYLLRYGPASIFGAFILAYLYLKRRQLGFHFDLGMDRLSMGAVFLVGGFLFAYLSSAPVLVFHYARVLFLDPKTKKRGSIWSAVMVALGSVGSFWWLRDGDVEPLLAGFASLAIGAWLSVVRLALVTYYSRGKIRAFYESLERGRSQLPPELVESYRTLREHGNAFQTLFWEIHLALVIFAVLRATTVEDNVSLFGVGLLTCLLWVYPAALAWYVATQLEIDLTTGTQVKPDPQQKSATAPVPASQS